MARLRMMRAPQKYVQGKNALLQFHNEMKDLGNRWLFICSKSGYAACHDQIEKSFGGADDVRHYEIFGGVSSIGEIDRMREIARKENLNVIVGVGGGVIYNNDQTFNSYLFYPKNPEAVLVDSSVIANAPVKFLVAGMGDALGTYFEARACERTDAPSLENGGITRSAMALCRLCYETLKEYGAAAKKACECHVVTPALDAVIEANVYLSGVGADNGGLAVAHSFYNGLTALGGHSAPHGCCVAFGTLVQLVLEGASKEEFKEVQDFCVEVGLPVTLEEIGITKDEEIRVIAEKSCVEGESIHNMVADVTPDQLYAAIVAADALGKVRRGM